MFGTADKMQPYVEFCIGGHTSTIVSQGISGRRENDACTGNTMESNVEVKGKVVLPYNGEHELLVRVRDRRRVQALIRGDPLIGEALLPLGPEIQGLSDFSKHEKTLPISRISNLTGAVSFRYQL